MSTRIAWPRELTARGAITRNRIVLAASNLVYARGVAGTSMENIMAASATSKSQLYHYFSSKDALMREVVSVQIDRVITGQMPELEHLNSLSGLRLWCDAILAKNEAMANGRCPVGSLANELSSQSEGARKLLVQSFELWGTYLAKGLADMQGKGELQPLANPSDLATAIMSALQGGILLAHTAKSSRPLRLALEMALAYVNQFKS